VSGSGSRPAPQTRDRCNGWDYTIALAGNPNTGKSTVFNALTGLRQHTGNWPGKTVTRAEGSFAYQGKRYKLIDLPGTYSLLSTSADEEVARDYILFGRPSAMIVVTDATRLERNLNLVLQILAITDRVVVAVNLIDEARRHGITVDTRGLTRDLGVPVVPMAARRGEGLPKLLHVVAEVASGAYQTRPRQVALRDHAAALRRELGDQLHDRVSETIYTEAAQIADRTVTRAGHQAAFRLDRAIDRVVTSRIWGCNAAGVVATRIIDSPRESTVNQVMS
jgi:Fe2+ transport system protein B